MSEIIIECNTNIPSGFGEEIAINIAQNIFLTEDHHFLELNIIFVDDSFLSELHNTYLKKPNKTDVISFDLSEDENNKTGEIYISVDRAIEQAEEYKVTVVDELYRYVIHGVLHLCGYDDTDEKSRQVMKKKEEFYLNLINKLN